MTEQTNGEDHAIEQHNSKVRGDRIREAHHALFDLEEQRGVLNSEMADIEKDLREAIGISLSEFQAIRKLVAMEPDKRDKAQDDLREAWEALMPGQTLDWVRFADKQDAELYQETVGLLPGGR